MIARCCVKSIARYDNAETTAVVCECGQAWQLGRRGTDVWLMHPQQTEKPPKWVDHVLAATMESARTSSSTQLSEWLGVGRDIQLLVTGIVKLLYAEHRRRSFV